MTAPAVNSDNVNATSQDAVKSECIQITASDNACGERLDRFLAAAITTRNSENGAPIDNHGLSRSRIKTLVLNGCLRENDTIIKDPSAAIKAGADLSTGGPQTKRPKTAR